MFGDWCGVWSQAGEDWAADGSTPGQDVEEERRQTEQSGLRPGPPHPLPLLPHSPQQGHRPDQQRARLGPGLGGAEDRAEQDLHSREHREHQLSFQQTQTEVTQYLIFSLGP